MHCAAHPGSPAVGLCVACGRGVCPSCSTRLQGRNFCIRCLEEVSTAETSDDALSSGAGLRGLLVVTVLSSGIVALVGVSALGFLLYMVG